MYCQNCGSELDQDIIICPYCGQGNNNFEIIREKDSKIQEMERKITELEQIVKKNSRFRHKRDGFNPFQPWFFIVPLVFVVVFFVFFIIAVLI